MSKRDKQPPAQPHLFAAHVEFWNDAAQPLDMLCLSMRVDNPIDLTFFRLHDGTEIALNKSSIKLVRTQKVPPPTETAPPSPEVAKGDVVDVEPTATAPNLETV